MAFGGLRGTLAGNATSITNPFSATGSVAVSVGDLVYAVLCEQTSLTVTAVSDNLGNTYSALNAGTDAGAATGRAFYSRVTVAGTLTSVSATCTASSDNVAFVVAVIEGPIIVSPLDANPANITSDITSPFTCPATGVLAQANEIVMCWASVNTSTSYAATSPNLLALQQASATVIRGMIGYQAVAATTSVSPAFTAASNPTQCILGTSSFKKDPAQTITGALYSDADSVFGATVSAAYTVAGELFSDGETFFAATVTGSGGAQQIDGALFADADTFQAASVASAYTIAGNVFGDADTFHSATLSTVYTISGSLFTDADSFGAAVISGPPVAGHCMPPGRMSLSMGLSF